MNFTELKGRAVVSLEDVRKIGEVEDLMVEPESRHIVSLKVKTGMFQEARILPMSDVKSVSGQAVTISTGTTMSDMTSMVESNTNSTQDNGALQSSKGVSVPAASISTGSSRSHRLIEISGILGNKVVTDTGTPVGELSDVVLNWGEQAITGYVVHRGDLVTKVQEFVDTPGVRYGNKLITIPAELMNQAT